MPSVVAHNSLALDLVVPRVHNATKRDYKVPARPSRNEGATREDM